MYSQSAVDYRLQQVQSHFIRKYGIAPNAVVMSLDAIKQFRDMTTMVEDPEAIRFIEQAMKAGISLPEHFGNTMMIAGLHIVPVEGPPNTIQVCLI